MLLPSTPSRKQSQYLKKVVAGKLSRLRSGAKPRALDLFSGCGGFSLGFQRAGFEISAAIEIDPDAARSHGINFHGGVETHCRPRDITATTPQQFVAELGLGAVSEAFDIIIGGPPCQAFARVGRSKLREIADHPEAFRHDPRSQLYINYIGYVEKCQPLAVVMENVPDMLNFGGHNLAEEIAEVLEARGYVARYTLLNAAFYGVPQMRERMFLIAVRRELVDEIVFPEPKNWIELPSGYGGSRAVALKLVTELGLFDTKSHYAPPPPSSPGLPPAVGVKEAIGDLPAIDARTLLRSGELTRGARRFHESISYRPGVASPYALEMRTWRGFDRAPMDHVIRYLPRDYELFARMKAGDEYPEAFALAERMFEEARAREAKASGDPVIRRSPRWTALRKRIVPPYDPSKFPNKWRKLEPELPSRTLMAHLGKDSYSHIHYDSAQARTISVREAARLQSFPDGFVFSGTMNPAFRQIGNAVPPLLAMAVASSALQLLRGGQATEARPQVAV